MTDRHARHRRADADRSRRPSDGHRSRDRVRFGRLVDDAAAGVPPPLRTHLGHVSVSIEDVPPPGTEGELSSYEAGTSRLSGGGDPDRLTLYRRPLELRAGSKADLLELVRATLVDELAARFGFDDTW